MYIRCTAASWPVLLPLPARMQTWRSIYGHRCHIDWRCELRGFTFRTKDSWAIDRVEWRPVLTQTFRISSVLDCYTVTAERVYRSLWNFAIKFFTTRLNGLCLRFKNGDHSVLHGDHNSAVGLRGINSAVWILNIIVETKRNKEANEEYFEFEIQILVFLYWVKSFEKQKLTFKKLPLTSIQDHFKKNVLIKLCSTFKRVW